jgi:hypothetical protein
MPNSTKNSTNPALIINYKTKSCQKTNYALQNIIKKKEIKNILINPEILKTDSFYYYN